MQWATLLAQEVVKADPTGTLPWLQTIVQLGSFGLIVFIAVSVIRAVPKIVKFLHDDREALIKAFKEEEEENRKTFRIEVETVRTQAETVRAQAEILRVQSDARVDKTILSVEKAISGLATDVKESTAATRDLVLEMQGVAETIKKANEK